MQVCFLGVVFRIVYACIVLCVMYLYSFTPNSYRHRKNSSVQKRISCGAVYLTLSLLSKLRLARLMTAVRRVMPEVSGRVTLASPRCTPSVFGAQNF